MSSGSETPSYSPLRPHYPALDGLRAVAALLVFCVHYIYGYYLTAGIRVPVLAWGFTGVDLFFVLSGFLITGILFDSRQMPSYFGDFYKRRMLRIFPVFYGLWVAIILLWPLLHPSLNRYNLSYLIYGGNVWVSWNWVAFFAASSIHVRVLGHYSQICIGHLWSLCIEEHFYILWPFIVWFFPVRRTLMWISSGCIVAILLLRIALYLHNPAFIIQTTLTYSSSYTRFDELLMGAWVALWLRGTRMSRLNMRRLAQGLTVLPVVIFFVSRWTLGRHWEAGIVNPQVITYGFTLFGLSFMGALLLSLDDTTWFYRILTLRPLMRLGKISYGFYVLHAVPWFFMVDHLPFFKRHHILYMVPVLMFLYSYGGAALSYRFYEKPFLKLKDKVSRRHSLPHREYVDPLPSGPEVA